jgi:hypothetical protein
VRNVAPELDARLFANPRSTNLLLAAQYQTPAQIADGRMASLTQKLESGWSLMSFEEPEGPIAQNIESCASSWQGRVGHELIFVRCMKEYVDVAASECTKSPGSREVMVIQIYFSVYEVWIALPGDGVTFVEAK